MHSNESPSVGALGAALPLAHTLPRPNSNEGGVRSFFVRILGFVVVTGIGRIRWYSDVIRWPGGGLGFIWLAVHFGC